MSATIQDATDARWRIPALVGPNTRLQAHVRTLLVAAVVGGSYYLFSKLGLALRFPNATTSVLWPPNALLTATLLLTASPRRWGIYLLAALPAHVALQLSAGWPVAMVLALFLTNCSEALVAVTAMRAISATPVRFDALSRMALFIGAVVLLAPFASSFPDAAVVAAWRGEPFWSVWRNRVFSNTLTELMLAPAIVMLVRDGRAWLREPRRRHAEAVAVAAFTLAVASALFIFPASQTLPGLSTRPLALLLGPVLWAACRFGPAGASLSLLGTTLVALWQGTHGEGVFAGLPPGEGVLTFQTVVFVVAVPVMCLAALVQQHRKAESLLKDRLVFERLVSNLAREFVQPPSPEMDAMFEGWMARLGESLGMERLAVLRLRSGRPVEIAYEWAASPDSPSPRVAGGDEASVQRLGDQLGAFARDWDAAAEETLGLWFHERGVGTSLTIPLVAAGRTLGGVAFVRREPQTEWGAELVQRLRLVADVLASALVRKDTEDALRGSEGMKSAILASLTTSVVVLDRDGRIMTVNDAWSRFVQERAGPYGVEVGVGGSLLDAYRHLVDAGLCDAAELIPGVQGVLDGSRPAFALEYACHLPPDERWIHMSAVPLCPGAGAVVSYTDVTERRQVELEAQRSRHELAHFLRVSTVGVMATSLAHELNQPLTAILANAQAARMIIDGGSADMLEVREILLDLIEEDKRAGDVIGRLRDMLRKGESHQVLLNVNALVRGVTRLASSDALIRNVAVQVDLDPAAPLVTGDRIQLQQVVLNLLLNALDSIGENGGGDRTVVVRTSADGERVRVSVSDSGDGVRPGLEERVFEPFYTTKTGGMGMGLSIARSIIAAHGGSIWAENNPGRGASFQFTLPVVRPSAD